MYTKTIYTALRGAVIKIYSPRNPRTSPLYQLVEDYHEIFENRYDELYQSQYGYFRPIIHDVLYKFLDCGDLHQGFARVRCDACGGEYLLAFSYKTRCFCPSCNQRRSLEFGEMVVDRILGDVPVRTCTFTIPKMLRPYFKFDHKLYPKLCRCAYETTWGQTLKIHFLIEFIKNLIIINKKTEFSKVLTPA